MSHYFRCIHHIATTTTTMGGTQYAINNQQGQLTSETVTFRDANPEWKVGFSETADSTRDLTYHGDVELAHFFARPIPLYTTSWTPGASFANFTFDPWSAFITNSRVGNRISNYKNFSGKMCVKIQINGNSFYYGRLMCYYVPLPYADSGFTVASGTAGKVLNSQRMKIFIDPCSSQAGTLCLPMIWYYDMVDLTTTDVASLGRMVITEMNQLKHANGAATPLNITIYGWLEDVKLSGPTATNLSGLVVQAGKDEYGDSPISGAASAVAKMSGRLSGLPIIGTYARATELGAKGVGAVAKMFGMSRPTVIEVPTLMRMRPIGELAVTDTGDTVNKLTVDSKQELAVGNASTGVDDGDELVLSKIASKETYLTTFTWASSYATNRVLFAARVLPQHYYKDVTYYTVPACCFVANAFKYWRGTMKYRFQIVASEYHKGRLLFVWDSHAGKTTPELNVQYTKVVDIGVERDFVLDIAWGQPRTWLETGELTDPYYRVDGTGFNSQASRIANGVLTVYVLNELTSPNSAINNDISVNVFCSMCDDAEFSVPSSRFQTYTRYTQIGAVPQSGKDDLGDVEKEEDTSGNAPIADTASDEFVPCNPSSDPTALVYMGESVSSFRQLAKRYNFMWAVGSLTATAGGFMTWSTTDFPLLRGYSVNGLRTGTTYTYNPVFTTMLRYLSFAFLTYKGGVRRKYVFRSGAALTQAPTFQVRRNVDTYRTVPAVTGGVFATAADMEDQAMFFATNGAEGLALTPLAHQPAVEVEFPFYSSTRFVSSRAPYTTTVTTPSMSDLTHTLTVQSSPNTNYMVDTYVSAAEDTNFGCFQGCLPFTITATFT